MNELGTRLERFLEDLPRDAGFVYGARERLSVNQLLLTLAERGELQDTAAPLKTLIAPLLCGTKEQQSAFYDQFDRAFGPKESSSPVQKIGPKLNSWSWYWLVATCLVAAILIFGIVQFVLWVRWPADTLALHPGAPGPPATMTVRGRVLSAAGALIPGVEVWAQGRNARTDANGSFTLAPFVPESSTIPVLLSHGAYGSRIQAIGLPAGPVDFRLTQPSSITGTFVQGREVIGPLVSREFSNTIFSPNGGRAITVEMGSAVLWEPSTGNQIARMPFEGAISDTPLVFSPDSAVLAVGESQPYIVDAQTGRRMSDLKPLKSPTSFVFRPDGRQIIGIARNDWGLFEISPTGRLDAVATAEIKWAGFEDNMKTPLVLTKTGNLEHVRERGSKEATQAQNVTAAALSPDGRLIATRVGNNIIISEGYERPIATFPACSSDTDPIVFSPNGQWLALASLLSEGCLHRLQPPLSIPLRKNLTTSLEFSADSRWLLTRSGILGGAPPTSDLVQVANGQPGPINSFSMQFGAGFTNDGRLLAIKQPETVSTEHVSVVWRWGGAAIPMLALASWWTWLWTRRARLRRFSLPLQLDTRALQPPAADPPFRGAFVRKLGLEMRRRKPVPSLDVDIEPTVSATVNCCGFLTPVYATRSLQREFLVLIQKLGGTDQHALLYSELCNALSGQGTLIDAFTFQGSPLSVHDPETKEVLKLDELAARYPLHDLWIIAGPSILQDPFTLDLAPWIAELSRWQNRALLSPVAMPRPLTVALEAAGLRVSEASAEGIAELLETMDSERSLKPSEAPAYPESLEHLPLRWLERTAPPGSAGAEMTSDLRRYLGPEGMTVLSACAVYPELHWPLTLFLASELCDPVRRDAVLTRVTSLPWLRHGRIPDWLRARLVARLTSDLELRVRSAIERFLSGVRPGAVLEGVRFARRTGPPLEGAPLRDYVMLEFLAGRKPDEKLVVRPPSLLKRLLFQGGHVVFGPRIYGPVAAMLALAIGAWFLAGFVAPTTPGSYRLKLAQWRLPGAAESTIVRTGPWPADLRLRAILETAESQLDQSVAAGSNRVWRAPFVDSVVSEAMLFASGQNVLPAPARSSKPQPGFAFQSGLANGFIESVARNGSVTMIEQNGNEVRRITSRYPPPGPYLDYSIPNAVSNPPVVSGVPGGAPGGVLEPETVSVPNPPPTAQTQLPEEETPASARTCATTLDACPVTGCAQPGSPQALLNQLKRTIPPKPPKFTLFSVADFARLQEQADQVVKQGSQLGSSDRAKLATIGEGQVVTVVGYIGGTPRVNAGESVNCNLKGVSNNDFHIPIVSSPGQSEFESFVAEMIPQDRSPGWTLPKLLLVRQRALPVRITGALFYDNPHVVNGDSNSAISAQPRRFTLWEIHPVTSFQVCVQSSGAACTPTSGTGWVSLENFGAQSKQ